MSRLTTRNGAPLSRLAFGTMQFGGKANTDASAEMFAACRAAGINHFDTAVSYTGGLSEMILGALITNCRDDVFVASKVGYTGGARQQNIRAQNQTSLEQLGVDSVDLLYLHRFDPETPLEETLETLAALQTEGRTRYLGLSNFAAWQIMKAQAIAGGLGTRIDAIQPMYSLVKRQAEVEIFGVAADQGLRIFPYSPLGGGLLTGKYARGDAGRLTEDLRYRARYDQSWMYATADALLKLAGAEGTDPATLAIAWVMAHPAGLSPIISARNVAQLTPSLAAASYEMSPDLYRKIRALSLTPPPATDRLEEA